MLKGRSRARASRSAQRYFPQCAACCSKQASAVKSGATRLVFHFYGVRPWYYAGEHSGGFPQNRHRLRRGVRRTLQQAGGICGKQARSMARRGALFCLVHTVSSATRHLGVAPH